MVQVIHLATAITHARCSAPYCKRTFDGVHVPADSSKGAPPSADLGDEVADVLQAMAFCDMPAAIMCPVTSLRASCGGSVDALAALAAANLASCSRRVPSSAWDRSCGSIAPRLAEMAFLHSLHYSARCLS